MSLADGLALLKQQHYAAAIATLQAVGQNHTSSAAERVRAQMGLVQAYSATGQTTAAIALCRQLAEHPHTQVKQWAQHRWRLLERQQTQIPASDFQTILPRARDALAQERFTDAIALLEAALADLSLRAPERDQYHILLLEAYMGIHDAEQAEKLCNVLAASHDPVVQVWVQQTRKRLRTPPPPPPSPKIRQLQTRSRRTRSPWAWLLVGALGVGAIAANTRALQTLTARWFAPTSATATATVTTPARSGISQPQTPSQRVAMQVPDRIVNEAVQQINSTNTPNEIMVRESVQYYEVQGRNARELWADIGDEAHYIVKSGGEGTHAIASAALKPRWQFTTQRTSTHCWISDVNIELDVLYTYPRWVNAPNAALELRQGWEQYARFLERHEEHHTQIAVEALSQVEPAILRLGAYPNCEQVIRAAQQIALNLWRDSDTAQNAFDQNENDPDQHILRRLAAAELAREQEAEWFGF